MDAMEKFVEEASVPVLTLFNNDPNNQPFVIKFFYNPNAKVKFFLWAFLSCIFVADIGELKSMVFYVDVN